MCSLTFFLFRFGPANLKMIVFILWRHTWFNIIMPWGSTWSNEVVLGLKTNGFEFVGLNPNKKYYGD
jgi:hypothetical protein